MESKMLQKILKRREKKKAIKKLFKDHGLSLEPIILTISEGDILIIQIDLVEDPVSPGEIPEDIRDVFDSLNIPVVLLPALQSFVAVVVLA